MNAEQRERKKELVKKKKLTDNEVREFMNLWDIEEKEENQENQLEETIDPETP